MPEFLDAPTRVKSAPELAAAVASEVLTIIVDGLIVAAGPLTLQPGQTLLGGGQDAIIAFPDDGLGLTANNRVAGIEIICPSKSAALYAAPWEQARGCLQLEGLSMIGRIALMFEDEPADFDLALSKILVRMADASEMIPRLHGNNVDVMHGALTVWNRGSGHSICRLSLEGLDIGSQSYPVSGSGIFIGGDANSDTRTRITRFSIGRVFADSTVEPGVLTLVSGGIFIAPGAEAALMECDGPVMTWGANAVAIDNWGTVETWNVTGEVVTHGPSAIALLNAGSLKHLRVGGEVVTYGDGARGCCIYGPTGRVSLQSLTTTGKAAVGVQVLNRLERIEVANAINTSGHAGAGLVKGEMLSTPAHGIQIEDGGILEAIDCAAIVASGQGALTLARGHIQG